jgi:predicted PurR-regulated permease PerM
LLTLRKKAFETALGFAVGMAWVFAVTSSIFTFIYFLSFGIFSAISFAIISFAISLIPVFIFEAIALAFESYEQTVKQTILLEEVLKKLDSNQCLDT